MPPLIVLVRIKQRAGARGFYIPLPLFLLWPLVLLVYAGLMFVFPFLPKEYRKHGVWAIIKASLDVFRCLSGLEVDVESGTSHVYLKFL